MKTGCPNCGDTLQGVMCEVPDHGQTRDLMIDWCMDCLEAKRFTLSAPKAPAPANPLDIQVAGGHYKGKKIQPVEYIHANDLNFLEGCIVKRITRWRDKPAADRFEDLRKIKHEIDLLIELESRS